jgi:hypothetical protein
MNLQNSGECRREIAGGCLKTESKNVTAANEQCAKKPRPGGGPGEAFVVRLQGHSARTIGASWRR